MQAITRAQAAVMLVRVAGLAAEETYADTFADAASIPAWAKGSIGAAAQAGLMHGYADGTFRAEGLIARAQAVVTLDRMVNRAADTVIETAGTVLENAAAAGNLVIAASVGEGEVTLKNVTVQGDLIVRGGGADSVYLDNVQVSGTVRLEKEYVHLHLMGGTVLERVEIRRPCRMTRDNSLRSRLGRLVIDLEKDSDREIQIEVPAERVELLSKAGAVLGADAETLRIGTGAEGAQLSIRSGATVEELTADARAKLTGSGTVSRLVVSVSGVSVSGSLTVKKIETLNGAKAPTVSGGSGGSSGGGTAPLRRITGAAPVPDVTVDYGTSEADAMAGLPGTVVLEAAENGSVSTVSAAVHWALDSVYDAYPLTERTYTAAGTVTIPAGYTYSGTLTVTTKLTVRGANPHAVIAEIWTVTGLELPFGAERRDAVLPIAVTVEDGKRQHDDGRGHLGAERHLEKPRGEHLHRDGDHARRLHLSGRGRRVCHHHRDRCGKRCGAENQDSCKFRRPRPHVHRLCGDGGAGSGCGQDAAARGGDAGMWGWLLHCRGGFPG